jgi:hypothetical protein
MRNNALDLIAKILEALVLLDSDSVDLVPRIEY